MNWLERFAEEMKNDLCVFMEQASMPNENVKRIKNGKLIIAVDKLDRDCVLIDAIQLVNTPVDLPQSNHIKKKYRLDFSTCFLHGN